MDFADQGLKLKCTRECGVTTRLPGHSLTCLAINGFVASEDRGLVRIDAMIHPHAVWSGRSKLSSYILSRANSAKTMRAFLLANATATIFR